MGKLIIYVGVIKRKTQAPHGKMKRGDTVVFHNNSATGSMTITIDGEDGAGEPLRRSHGGDDVKSFEVARNSEEEFVVNPDYKGNLIKYSAKVEGTEKKDPIIIIV